MKYQNVVGVERFLRGALGASLLSWALNGNPEGWAGLFFTLTAILQYCPIRRFAEALRGQA
ncbi:MAG: DUF2892 domain-containing protein [Candidatus Eremiobacteraeota bacterium]|nr:DUF2892 domain-containing protein [Candidatus Eremiobacteraeota bacterium]MCW5870726.1 DUF2892 domain-containing protein [Candidatus Eremiobacteraeota bacterium]